MKRLIPMAVAVAMIAGAGIAASAHEGEHFSAGVPGDPKKPARTVEVKMSEGDGTMKFTPDHLDVKKDEQVRFVIENNGSLKHEFTLASVQDNDKHAEMMRKFPDMEHDDPNAKTVDPGKSVEMLWRFTKSGRFEFACLIPGHREAGMHGFVSVK